MNKIHNNSKTHDFHICKDSGSARAIQKIRNLFLTVQSFTAMVLNALVGFNDARKAMPILQDLKEWPIDDCWLPDGRKVYQLEKGVDR